MTSHTPGPWRLAKEPPAMGITVTLYGYGPKTLGVIHTGSDEYIANARLIAAAPDMLAALTHCLGILCEAGDLNNYRNLSDAELGKAWIETAKEASAAIAKAEGKVFVADSQRRT